MGLLKVQEHALRQLSCPLEIMQYMKRAARVTYDKDQLFKVKTLTFRLSLIINYKIVSTKTFFGTIQYTMLARVSGNLWVGIDESSLFGE